MREKIYDTTTTNPLNMPKNMRFCWWRIFLNIDFQRRYGDFSRHLNDYFLLCGMVMWLCGSLHCTVLCTALCHVHVWMTQNNNTQGHASWRHYFPVEDNLGLPSPVTHTPSSHERNSQTIFLSILQEKNEVGGWNPPARPE